MKNRLLSLTCVLLLLAGCQKENPEPPLKKGLIMVDVGIQLDISELGPAYKAVVPVEDFRVLIFQEDGTQVRSFDRAALMPDTIELETGVYYVVASSDNDVPAEFENPFYFGQSETFEIGPNTLQSVEVRCVLSNTVVSVSYSAYVEDHFTDWQTTVATSLDSLVFMREEIRRGYFRTLPMNIRSQLSYIKPDGSDASIILRGSITDPLPNRHYRIEVDAAIAEGMGSFAVILDSSEVPVEIVQITGNQSPLPVGDIGPGELLITEIMADPTALSDTYGEWFEVYNNSGHMIDLQGLIIQRDDINQHTIDASIELQPGDYYLLARTDSACGTVESYVYASAILLPNTGAVLSIHNEDDGGGPGPLIFSIDYGASGFPGGSGASIQPDPLSMDPAAALLGSSWCVSGSAFATGDLGTPGAPNEICN